MESTGQVQGSTRIDSDISSARALVTTNPANIPPTFSAPVSINAHLALVAAIKSNPEARSLLHNYIPEPALVSGVTHVNLSFIDSAFFDTPGTPDTSSLDPFFTDIDSIRAKFPKGTKVLWALGGWVDSKSFSVLRTPESRRLFAKNVKQVVDAIGIDGIDLDWEYPGGNGEDYKQPGSTNADKVWEIDAYPELVAELRTALGPSKLLCAALPGVPGDMMAFDAEHLAKTIPLMDFFNIMTYDLSNRRNRTIKHHAGIEDSLIAVNQYLSNGMPPEKAILGFAFYLRWFKTLPAKTHVGSPVGLPLPLMEDPVTGADLGGAGQTLWCNGPDPWLAASFERAMKDGSYDERHGAHYYLDREEDLFWSWESPDAILKKYNATMTPKSLGGVFAWELGGDGKDWSRLKALNSAVGRVANETSA